MSEERLAAQEAERQLDVARATYGSDVLIAALRRIASSDVERPDHMTPAQNNRWRRRQASDALARWEAMTSERADSQAGPA